MFTERGFPLSLKRMGIEAFITRQKQQAILPHTRDVVIVMRKEGMISKESYDAYILFLEEYLSKLELQMHGAPKKSSQKGNVLDFAQEQATHARRRLTDTTLFISSFGKFLQRARAHIDSDISFSPDTQSHEIRAQQVNLAIGLFEKIHTPLKPTPSSPIPFHPRGA